MTHHTDIETHKRSIWVRGLLMFVFLILFGLAETLLAVLAVVQFFWAVFTGGPNVAIRDFGAMLGDWLREVARFQSMDREEAPFPWGDWPKK